MSNHELLQRVERDRLPGSRPPETTVALTLAQIQKMALHRREMFGSVERYISTRLQNLLREKIYSEEKLLAAFFTAQHKARTMDKKTAQILHRGFFELRPLDTSLLE